MWYKTSNRKPFYNLKASMRDFFTEHVRFIHESNTIESQFEKPYLDNDYHKMHLNLDFPDWLGGDRIRKSGCAFKENPSSRDKVIFSGGVINPVSRSYAAGPFNMVIGNDPDTDWYKTCVFCVSKECPGYQFNYDLDENWFEVVFDTDVKGIVTVTGDAYCSGGAEGCRGVIPADACTGKDYLELHLELISTFCTAPKTIVKDGEICYKVEKIPCTCSSADPIVFVYGTPNEPPTVVRSSSVNVTITGGVSPYTWTITGTGFWLDAGYTTKTAITTGLTITVYSDGTGCGTGLIVVTDSCSQTGNGAVRSTTGSWTIDVIKCPTCFSCTGSACVGKTTPINGPYTSRIATNGYRYESAYRLIEYVVTSSCYTSINCGGTDCLNVLYAGCCAYTGRCITNSVNAWFAQNTGYTDVGNCCARQTGYTYSCCLRYGLISLYKWVC